MSLEAAGPDMALTPRKSFYTKPIFQVLKKKKILHLVYLYILSMYNSTSGLYSPSELLSAVLCSS